MRRRSLRDRLPNRLDLRVFAGYIAAALVYVVIGVSATDFLLSFWVGVLYLAVVAWVVPAAVRRLGSR